MISALTRRTFALIAVLALAGVAPLADQVTVGSAKDNTLYEDQNGNLSNGAGTHLFAGWTQSRKIRRGLIAFDIAGSGIPAGSSINSVTLTLNLSRARAESGTQSIALHRVLADWGEGASVATGEEGGGGTSTTGDATWLHTFYNTDFWSSPGGDFDPNVSASTDVGIALGFVSWSSAVMAADVQGWLDNPSSNFGWLLQGNESVRRTAKRFDTKEVADPSLRPALLIDYTPPATLGACCIGFVCSELDEGDCTTAGGTFQGAGTTCATNPCAAPTGACCAGDGSCSVDTASTCTGGGGAYQGDATTCTPNPCPQPTGGCCFNDGTCSVETSSDCGTLGGNYQGNGTDCASSECPVILTPWLDALPLPAPATPTTGNIGGTATYDIAVTEQNQQLHTELPPTTVWGYAGLYPGPTIEASEGNPVTVNWINDLRDPNGTLRSEHYLPVDTCPHGPDTEGNTPRIVTHLHGGHVPADVDGYPEDTFLPGFQVQYTYPNNQAAGTLWYHDHALGITRLNVMMGLAGYYLLRDATEASLGLPSGEYEIPLAIQDRAFHSDGSLKYPVLWQDHFFGDTIMVNGKAWPYLNVKQGKYRFRILNGSNSRAYTLTLSDPNLPFTVIGTEGGLLPAPVTTSQFTFGPGERIDLVIDFAGQAAGTEIILQNSAPAPFPGTPGIGVIPEILKFIVTADTGFTAALPGSLRPVPPIDPNEAVIERDFLLKKQSDPCAGSMWTINGLHWNDITEYPELDTVEIWRFINDSGISHPMHMHLVFFQILDRTPVTFDPNGAVVPTGPPVPPPPHEAGWKDTAMVGPGEMLRVIARFTDYTGKYAYHCHILEHEDHEMMRQFQSVDCGNAVLEPTEECDPGDELDGDGCAGTCDVEMFVELSGVAQGGSVTLTVDGLPVPVTTSSGQTAADVASALAAAINADPNLAALGTYAWSDGTRLITTGTVTDVVFTDPGLQDLLELTAQQGQFWWSSVGGAVGYDLVRGDLASIGAAGMGTLDCLADDATSTAAPLGPDPAAPGEGYWYLLRDVLSGGAGSYDDPSDASQSGSRDTAITASGNGCP